MSYFLHQARPKQPVFRQIGLVRSHNHDRCLMETLAFFILFYSCILCSSHLLRVSPGPCEFWNGTVQRMFAFLSLKCLGHLVRGSACVGVGSLLTLCKV